MKSILIQLYINQVCESFFYTKQQQKNIFKEEKT